MTDTSPEAVAALTDQLRDAMVASCGCAIKTHEWRYHEAGCLYRTLNEAKETLAAVAKERDEARAAIKRLVDFIDPDLPPQRKDTREVLKQARALLAGEANGLSK